jgi:hypothetical protein
MNSAPKLSIFEVTLNYGRQFPIFVDRINARDEEHSKLIARFNAEAKGYPKNVEFGFETVKSAY